MAPFRVRQHVNPLSQKYQQGITSLDWGKIYLHSQQPLYLDIGCARGKFLLDMAQLQPQNNFLGIEIRQPLVEYANIERDRLELTNLHYLFANANVVLAELLPPASLAGVTIQFPDPWFKRRHQKRRVVQPELVAALATRVRSGSFIFIQSDILEVAAEIRDRFAAHPGFIDQTPGQWLATNPLPVATERELWVLEHELPVYRCCFIRQD